MVKKKTGLEPRKASRWDRFLNWLVVQAEETERQNKELPPNWENPSSKAFDAENQRRMKAMQDDYERQRRREEENRWRQNR